MRDGLRRVSASLANRANVVVRDALAVRVLPESSIYQVLTIKAESHNTTIGLRVAARVLYEREKREYVAKELRGSSAACMLPGTFIKNKICHYFEVHQ